MGVYRCGALPLVVAACSLASVSSVSLGSDGDSTVSIDGKRAEEQRPSPPIEGFRRSGKLLRRPAGIEMQEATQSTLILSAISRMAPLAMLLGMGALGYRLYGFRQGRSAT